MAVPDFQTLMKPVLETLAKGGQWQVRRELVPEVAKRLGLSSEDVAETIPSGMSRFDNRVMWAVSYMFQAGVVSRPRRGYAEITDRGHELLTAGHDRITVKILEQYPEFVEFKQRAGTRKPAAAEEPATGASVGEEEVTPAELVERAEGEANAAVQAELLRRIHAQPPDFLERLVLKLLVAMGYGERIDGAADHVGRPGDEGIDGVVRQDPLGIDVVYLQAKRYAPDSTVGRPDIQAFVGALHGAQANRGIFITTSRFSPGAMEYAERVGVRVILIDGSRLTELMLRYGIGVEPDLVATLYRVDEDFFER
jgi:restriction system protein